jgi:hypothetical protein
MTNVVREEMGFVPLDSSVEYDIMAYERKGNYEFSEIERRSSPEDVDYLNIFGFDASLLDGQRAYLWKEFIEILKNDEVPDAEKIKLGKSIQSAGSRLTESGFNNMLKKVLE